ncbi:Crp/Fnr family transcriptional regulator [Acidipila sp. EB88]|uniref:Crp/Fnr family transcriptional regulator n=1 Tax=Acidipila sp. EB88 TaxID=2305226 RepID=UPI001F1A67D9|nr:Crp/Fnr family transcriptional regulator [Acidipila sp. EB88]
MNTRFENRLLQALDEDSLQRLDPQPVSFELMRDLEVMGGPIRYVYFIEEGLASITTTFDNGSQVEVGMVGYEGAVGFSAMMGTKQSLNRVYTQIPGRGYRVPLRTAKEEFNRSPHFKTVVLCYVQTQLIYAMQTAGCNAKHSIQERLARWLLACKDCVKSTRFCITQSFLADMLGTGRPAITHAADRLKQDNLITYRRGMVEILDIAGLEARSCECYAIVQNHLNNFLEYDSGQAHA